MQQKKIAKYLIGTLVLLLVLYTIVARNSLVAKQEKMEQMWAQVQSSYQHRLDLTPNLVNIVKGVSEFEQTTLTKIAEARSAAQAAPNNEINAGNYKKQSRLQDTLAAASNKLIMVIEKYPVLKGTQAYRGLQMQLEGIERRIKVARTDFNASVKDYNQAVRSFPKNLIAKLFGFNAKSGFEAVAGAENNVEIKF